MEECHIEEQFPSLTSLAAQILQYCLAQDVDKVLQILGGIDVNDKGIVMLLDLWLFKTMAYEVCLAQSSR